MVNVLLSSYDFNNEYCYFRLHKIIKPGMSVCIIPFSHDDAVYEDIEKFEEIYNPDRYDSDFCRLERAFRDFGVTKMRVIHPKDNDYMIEHKIKNADILFFTGGDPVKTMKRLQPLHYLIKSFDGIVMGASAGAMIQVHNFVIASEGYEHSYHRGLCLTPPNIDVIVHYTPCEHIYLMMCKSMEDRPDVNLYAISDGDCIII